MNCVAPGFVVTEYTRTLRQASSRWEGYSAARPERWKRGRRFPRARSRSCLVSRSGASEPITGKLISARWDPWQDEEFLPRLEEDADFGTLRRIDGQFFTKIESDASAS